ncbi:LysR family transcriptional regulator [Rhodobacter sp. Har01]|uniref:LysR family transcriptional regulator n=1 Tax=Rhodobacter sp. Har01 TaxID=2883999 RepID=UPI001D07D4FB|nr:LysR family transcriptional regulator [Rhodobacter sp. Har01]MCB6177413.1 LysR family transcriptional regulator [Rhodobacter sp. Har01]
MPTSRPDPLQARGLKLSHLRLMAALVETGQIGLAAEALGIAQPAASRLLAEVERIVGQPVHERTGRGMTLTALGEALARRAQRVQMELRDAARDLAEIGAGTTGHVRIGAVTGPALDRVLPSLRAARLTLPQITAEVVVAPSDLLCQQLLSGRLDFALARRSEGPDRDLLDDHRLTGEPVALIARRAHPLDRPGPIAPLDLMAHDWVMPGRDVILTRTVLARLAALGLPEPPQRLSTSSFLLTLAMLQQSNAIAPIADAVVQAFTRAPDAPYVRLPVDLGIVVEPFGLLTRAGRALPPAAARLAQMMIDPSPTPALPSGATDPAVII